MTDDIPTSDPASTVAAAQGGTPFSERARIDQAPPAKRLDALPVLYVVGFVILAAALIYLWKHPSLPQNAVAEVAQVDTLRQQADALRQQMGALTTQVTALQAQAAPPAADLAPLDARIRGLEQRPAPAVAAAANLAPLEARIAALEGRPAAASVDLKPLESRIAVLEGRAPVDLRPLEGRVAGLEGRKPVDLGPLTQRLDGLGQKEADDVGALGKRLDQVEAAGKQTASGLAAIAERAQQAGRLQAMSAALAAGQRLGDVPGAPPALARFARDAPPTEAGLRLSFNTAAGAAHDASQPALAGDRSFLDRMWGRAQQSVTVRQGDKVLVGDPIVGFIEHARQSLDAGDLQGAVSALDGLAGPAKAAMSGWVGQAQSLLDARAAIGALAARG